jgi:hypothetical protein|tara:strand:- start:2276 stop:2542 length:267 start_codon:yes stop_codon:yes gene_type:complete
MAMNPNDVNWTVNTTEKFLETTRQVDKLEMEHRMHEVQCEERWKTTFQRLESIDAQLSKMDQRMLTLGGTIILFLAGVIVTLITMQGV